MMMILNLHFAIFLGSSWQIVGGLETPYITCCSLVVPATLKDHPVRWEKDEGQWRSYPLNDSIELDRYWQAFQAQAAGNEAKCSVLGSFFFESFGWCDTKRHMLQICNQCPKISFSNRSKHRVTHSPGVPGCCDKSQVEVVEKRCRLGPQFLTTKLSSVVALWITFLELMNCLFVLSQKISWISTYWGNLYVFEVIRSLWFDSFSWGKNSYIYMICVYIYITTYTETLCVMDLIALA